MSRLLIICMCLVGADIAASPLSAQAPQQAQQQVQSQPGRESLTDAELQKIIDKQKRIVAVDIYGCRKYVEEEGIVVCGPDLENESQKLPERIVSPDRIRRGEAVSTERAAAADLRNCGVIGAGLGCTQLPKNWIKFNYSPPYPPDYDEVMKGLPDAEQVKSAVTDDDGRSAPE